MTDTIRVWRVRKDHTWIDARLLDAAPDGVELQFFYDNALVFARHCPTPEEAVATAETYRRNLERAGWNTHW